eukprot:COSAG04_NODE_3585_length_2690_cov_6.461598_3_plen_141_part_00
MPLFAYVVDIIAATFELVEIDLKERWCRHHAKQQVLIKSKRPLGLLTLSNLKRSTRAASSPGSSEVASSHSSGLGFHSRMLNAQRMAWGLLLDTDNAGAATDACRQKAAADFKGAVGGNRSRFQSDNNHDSRMSNGESPQ